VDGLLTAQLDVLKDLGFFILLPKTVRFLKLLFLVNKVYAIGLLTYGFITELM